MAINVHILNICVLVEISYILIFDESNGSRDEHRHHGHPLIGRSPHQSQQQEDPGTQYMFVCEYIHDLLLHTIQIYAYMYVCVCVCVCVSGFTTITFVFDGDDDDETLNQKIWPVQLALANPGTVVAQKLREAGLIDKVGIKWLFLTAGEAVDHCTSQLHVIPL